MLVFKNISIGYQHALLENISGEIFPNSAHFLIGKNGSGKTTFLKTLAKILNPLSGSIESGGAIYLAADMPIQFGLTGYDLFDLYDVKKSKWYFAETLAALDVPTLLKKPIEELSSGERQRVLLCATLLHSADLVLLDEPLSHLDWDFSKILKNVLEEYANRGRGFLIANHDLNWCQSFQKSQTWVLFKNKIYLQGSTAEVFGDIKLKDVFQSIDSNT